ncbi:rod shape-determining protein [Paenibacillus sp. FSL K6-3166]|uniref:rod shape-determining protein n=1 Tax=unclassified Paenibacillus TaxID=185978 RepID=UPI000BA0F167|nr:rod shape-determining protein [Paenibacillus sp. VTT E-133291]OZQ78308.1 hypothetical protein CA598_29330 [Paenibacillus sp. VTT E-133291]
MLHKTIGIDLGTSNIRIFVYKKGIVIDEPTVAAMDGATMTLLAAGEGAVGMLGRTPESVTVFRPIRDGVVAEFAVAVAMLKYFF